MNSIDIVVSDLDASIAFYRRLGLEFETPPCLSTPAATCPTACT